MKDFYAFRRALAARESGGNYLAKNPYGFLGAFQFGVQRLADFGLTYFEHANATYRWVEPFSERMFLESKVLQNLCFRVHVVDLIRRVKRLKGGEGHSLSGLVAGAHLLGLGGLVKFVREGVDGEDANGTKISEYVRLFSGFDIEGS